ncbi:hypothetical protein ACFE4M_004647 [Salmonella enterica]
MKHQHLTEAETRRLAEAIAAEARALGFVGKEKKMPKETKRRIRARVLKAILDDRTAARKREEAQAAGREPEDTFAWQPQRRR